MKKALLVVSILVLSGLALAYWYGSDRGRLTTEPEFTGLARSASGNDLISGHDPAAILRFGPEFRYLGGQKFVLYGVADAEQHFFVETTADNKLKSVYWVQYEAYLPDRPHSTYNYDHSPLRMKLGDFEFYADTAAGEFDPGVKRKRGTDGAMARQFLASNGYTFPRDYSYARLVYLTDESRRKELMIIFIDDLTPHGFKAANLKEGGVNASDWPRIEQAHLQRIRTTLAVLPYEVDHRWSTKPEELSGSGNQGNGGQGQN